MNETERAMIRDSQILSRGARAIDQDLQAREQKQERVREALDAQRDAERVQLQALDELRSIAELIKLTEELPDDVGIETRAAALEKLHALANRALVHVVAVFPR